MPKVMVSVIVCTYNRYQLLYDCLNSLVNQTLDKSFFEVIVIDNNSNDNTQNVIKQFESSIPNFRYFLEKEQGLSYARNRGWKEAKGKYIAYLDDDAIAPYNYCEKIANIFETTIPTPVVVGGPIYPRYNHNPPSWFTDDLEIRTWGDTPHFLLPPAAQFGFSGSNMVIQIDILKKYQGFATQFGMKGNKLILGEETELFTKIYKEYPYFWYDPTLIVKHWTPRGNMKITYRIHRSYKSGVAKALMLYGKEKKIICKRNGIRIWKLIKYSKKIPFLLLKSKNKTEFVINLQNISHTIGYIIGNI